MNVKRKFLTVILTMVFALGLVSSCQENDVPITTGQNPETDNIAMVDGVLKFDDHVHFQQTIDQFYESNLDMISLQPDIKGFKSLQSNYQELLDKIATIEDEAEFRRIIQENSDVLHIVERDGEQELVCVSESDILSSFFNKEGFLMIGDSVFKATYDYWLATTISKIDLLRMTGISSRLVSDTDIKVIPIIKRD